MAHKLVVLGPMQIFSAILESVTIFSGPVVILSAILGSVTTLFGPEMILSAILRTVTTLFGPGVTLSAILRSVMTVLADLGGVGTILAGGNIVIYFHSHRSGEHLKEIEFL